MHEIFSQLIIRATKFTVWKFAPSGQKYFNTKILHTKIFQRENFPIFGIWCTCTCMGVAQMLSSNMCLAMYLTGTSAHDGETKKELDRILHVYPTWKLHSWRLKGLRDMVSHSGHGMRGNQSQNPTHTHYSTEIARPAVCRNESIRQWKL